MKEDELGWRWAYNEQLRLLDLHDAWWIELSQNQWLDEELARFLQAYGLVRGNAGQLVFANTNQGNRAEFYRICKDIFQRAARNNTDLTDADRTWKCAVEKIKEKFNDLPRLYSALSKLLWFHQPNNWIMFDSLNRAALATWLKTNNHITSRSKLSAANFTEGFQKFYEAEGRDGASIAASFFSRSYPYSLRVAEKYLWLMGLQETKRTRILDSYRASRRMAPDSHVNNNLMIN